MKPREQLPPHWRYLRSGNVARELSGDGTYLHVRRGLPARNGPRMVVSLCGSRENVLATKRVAAVGFVAACRLVDAERLGDVLTARHAAKMLVAQ